MIKKDKNWWFSICYASQKSSSKKRNHKPPIYTKNDLIVWLFNDWLFNLLFDNYVNCGFVSSMKPSLDRLDDSKGYSLDNIQLMTWGENRTKSHMDRANGKLRGGGRHGYPSRTRMGASIAQYSKTNIFIAYWSSFSSVGRAYNVHSTAISKCVKLNTLRNETNYRTSAGFIWRFA